MAQLTNKNQVFIKSWTKPNSYEENHNIKNADLKQKHIWKLDIRQGYKTVLNCFNERNNYPWHIVKLIIKYKIMEEYKTIDLNMLIIFYAKHAYYVYGE